jgi:hypothetical protein
MHVVAGIFRAIAKGRVSLLTITCQEVCAACIVVDRRQSFAQVPAILV